MSFVSIIASARLASAVSDGWLVDLSDNGESVILPGSKPSMVRISERQIIACTGSASVLKIIKNGFPFQKNDYVFDESRMNFFEQSVQEVPYEKQDVLLALIDASGPMTCSMFSNEPGQSWHVLRPDGGRLATMFLAGRAIDEVKIKKISEEFNRLLRMYGEKSSEQIFSAQRALNHLVSGLDPSVGPRTYRQLVTC